MNKTPFLQKFSKLFGAKKKDEAKEQGRISKDLLRSLLPDDPVVVEAGAHVGRDTVEMSRLWPKGLIHAFEPIPDLFARLKTATTNCSNVICYESALGEKSGALEFNVSSGKSNASSSVLSPKQHLEQHPDVKFETRLCVNSVTLDDWARQYQVKRVDFLWLDLQGYELFALKAGREVLPKVRAIYSEVYLKESYQGVPLYPELREWLARQGFKVEWEGLPWPDSGNVLFVRC